MNMRVRLMLNISRDSGSNMVPIAVERDGERKGSTVS